MEFWQQNKLFVIVAGTSLLALVLLWPSLWGLGPAVVSLHRTRYERAMMDHRSLEEKMNRFFPKSGKGVPIKNAVRDIEAANSTLTANLDELRAWMSFLPRFPFRIPEPRQGNERARYVSLVFNYARNGELLCPEYTIKDPSDGVVWLASTRNVPLRDAFFGMGDMALPEAIRNPETRITQIALAHELGHLAIRLNVDEITSIVPAEPYTCRINDTDMALAYPANVRIKCDLPTLLAFVHALAGAHGAVVNASGAAQPPEGIVPIIPKAPEPPAAGAGEAPPAPKAKPGGADPDDPGDPGGAPQPMPAAAAPVAPAAAAPEAPAAPPIAEGAPPQKLAIRLAGSPAFLSPDATQGTLKERFTLFRRDEQQPQKLQFIANAIATKVLDPGTPALTPGDVLNWTAFCSRLKSQAEGRAPSLGKRIWPLLSPAAVAAIEHAAGGKELTDAQKSAALASLNEVLAAQRALFAPEDFAGISISNEAEGLLKLDRQAMTTDKLHRLNRLLLEAAYPREIAKAAVELEAVVEPSSDLRILPDGKGPVRSVVRPGDFASTRFFLVRSLRVKAVPGALKADRDGFPSELVPPHLEVELAVAALSFLEVQAPKPADRKPAAAADAPVIRRGL